MGRGKRWVLAFCSIVLFLTTWYIVDGNKNSSTHIFISRFIGLTDSDHSLYPKPWLQGKCEDENYIVNNKHTIGLRVITEGIDTITLDPRVSGVFYRGELLHSSNKSITIDYREPFPKNTTKYMRQRIDDFRLKWATLKLKTPEDTTQRTHVVIGCKGLKKLQVQTMGRNEKDCSKVQEIVVNTPYPLTLDYLGIKSMRAPHRYPYELNVNAKAVKMIQNSSSLTKIAIRGKINDFYGEIMVVHPFDLTNATIKSCILLERFPMPETITEKKIFVGKIHHLFYMGTKDNVDLKYPIPYVRKEIRAYEDIQKPIYL